MCARSSSAERLATARSTSFRGCCVDVVAHAAAREQASRAEHERGFSIGWSPGSSIRSPLSTQSILRRKDGAAEDARERESEELSTARETHPFSKRRSIIE